MSHEWRHVERCCGRHGVPTIWAFVVCGVLLQRTYFLKRVVPWCRVLCSVCCLVGINNKKTTYAKKNKRLDLYSTDISDEGLVALAPALRRRPALEALVLARSLFGDEGLAGSPPSWRRRRRRQVRRRRRPERADEAQGAPPRPHPDHRRRLRRPRRRARQRRAAGAQEPLFGWHSCQQHGNRRPACGTARAPRYLVME